MHRGSRSVPCGVQLDPPQPGGLHRVLPIPRQALVEQQCSQWQWAFVFLGADMDAVQEGVSVGVPQKSSLTFDKANARLTYAMASNYVSAVRGGGKAEFSDEDRKSATKGKRV